MQAYVDEFRSIIDQATPALLALTDVQSAQHPAPGKWSPREVVGHLIDSASNNHQRFVRARFQNDLVLVGYDQDAWVALQKYQDEPWVDLVTLWRSFNVHLAHVMASIPASVRGREHGRHNLHEINWRPVPAGKPATLDDLMEDYVAHLKHHLRQILGSTWDVSSSVASSKQGRG
jgi:DinB family protein